MASIKNFKKDKKIYEERGLNDEKGEYVPHADFQKNHSDALKLIEYWTPRITDHVSKLRFNMSDKVVYLTYSVFVSGREYLYSSPHPFDQSWDEFRGSVTFLMRELGILGKRDDIKASQEWRLKHGVQVTEKGNSQRELFQS